MENNSIFQIAPKDTLKLLDIAKEILWKLDINSDVLYFNETISTFLGYTSLEISKGGWKLFTTNSYLLELENQIENLICSENQSIYCEIELIHKNGEFLWAELKGIPETTQNGKIAKIVGTLKDITDRKISEIGLQKSKANLKAMFDSSPQIYVLINPNYEILSYNKMAKLYYENYRQKEIIQHRSFLELVSPERMDLFISNFSTAFHGEIVKYQHFIEYDNNKKRWFETMFLPVEDLQKQIIAVAYSRLDITEQKEHEIAQKHYNEQLRELNATKDKLFSIIAHDLKNPFNSIMGIANLLYMNIKKYDSSRIEELCKNIADSSRQGYILLENLLDWSLSQTGKININPVFTDAYSLVSEAVSPVLPTANAKGITIFYNISEHVTINVDREMLKTVVRNLVSNAVKFSYSGDKIYIAISKSEYYAYIAVEDEGVGISTDKLENLFNIEKNNSSRGTQNEKGTGIGLLICKDFVEKNKGKISIEKNYPKGTIFRITLPLF